MRRATAVTKETCGVRGSGEGNLTWGSDEAPRGRGMKTVVSRMRGPKGDLVPGGGSRR